MAIVEKDIRRFSAIYKALKEQREPLVQEWRYIARNIDPYYGLMNEESRPQPMNNLKDMDIADTTIRYYSNLFAIGLEGYACSSKSNFFALRPADDTKGDDQELIKVIQERERIIYDNLAKQGFYASVVPFLKAFGDLGTGVMIMGWKDGKVYYETVPPYQCQAMKDPYTNKADVLFRSIWLTKHDAQRTYGKDSLPKAIRESQSDVEYFRFIQMFFPRGRFEDVEITETNDPFVEVVWAYGYENQPVFVGGDRHQRFIVCPFADAMDGVSDFAWGVNSPGQRQYMTAKALNVNLSDQWRSARLMAAPPIKKTENIHAEIRPGGFIDVPPGGDLAAMQMGADLSWTAVTAQRLTQLAKSDYYVDFFLMLSQYQGNVNTATLAQGLQNEQVNMMTTLLDTLARRFFEDVIEYTYYTLEANGKFPQSNVRFDELEIDYVSPLYLMQRQAVSITPTTQLMGEIVQLAQLDPAVLAYVDIGEYIRVKQESTNADARIIVPEDKAKETINTMTEAQASANRREMDIEQQKADAQTTAAQAKAEPQSENRFQGLKLR